MLKTNLSILLAERGIKAKKVSRETGISQTTLTSLVNNTGKGVQFDTVDTLCRYLNIEPENFFDFYPIHIESEADTNKYNLKWQSNEYYQFEKVKLTEFNFDFFIDLELRNKKYNFSLTGNFKDIVDGFPADSVYIGLAFDKKDEQETFEKLISEVPLTFRSVIENNMENEIKNALHKAHSEWIEIEKGLGMIPEGIEDFLDMYATSLELTINLDDSSSWLFDFLPW